MSGLIAVIDYGMGNLRSVQKGFEKIGADAVIVDDPADIALAKGVVLPGVGAFVDAIAQLKKTGLDTATLEAIKSGRPFLGICLGLQLLFERSFENGDHAGLGVFSGTIERIPAGVKVPHMGWNQVKQAKKLPLFDGIPDAANFYFVHSYIAKPADPAIVATTTDYGGDFVSGVARDNVYAFQFHPEKSGLIGLQILRNFKELCQ